jgi:hypothetical protein
MKNRFFKLVAIAFTVAMALGMSCCKEKKAPEKIIVPKFIKNIREYLDADFTSFITEVDAGINSITVKGNYTGGGDYALCEIPPYDDVTELKEFKLTRPLSASPFTETFDRYVERDGFNYDRTLSKWLIVKKGSGGKYNTIASHARYPDRIYATQATTQQKPAGKKGLGGYFNHGVQRQDLNDMEITSATVNLGIDMLSSPEGNCIEHQYGGKS